MLKRLIEKVLASRGYKIVRNDQSPATAPLPAGLNLEWLKQYNIRTFIDIGACVGEYVDFAHSFFPGALIYAFEPLSDGFATLKKKESEIPGLTVLNYAIGDEDIVTQMYRSSYAPSSSLLKMAPLHREAFPHTAGQQVEAIEVRRLDGIFETLPLEPDIFVKIDTQGYEDRVIAGGQQVLSQAKIIQLEVSFEILYEGQALFDTIYTQLRPLGFVFHGVKNQVCSPKDGSILQAHAYFIKRTGLT